MQNNAVTASRRLLPRWRTLARTPACEIPASRIPAKQKGSRRNLQLQNALARWEQTKALVDASDVIDAALVSGDYAIAAPTARSILRDGNAVTGLNDAARQVLGEVSDRPLPLVSPAGERDTETVHRSIAALKWRLRAAPRDALTALEIARLQSLIGQTRSAERYIELAVKLAPNDRYVLRSAARFWTHCSSPGDPHVHRALEVIWASDAVRVDPWVQAAEVSVANICKKSPRWGVKAGKELLRSEPGFVQYSELASGLAALEQAAGAPMKQVRKLMRISLRAPTENALAQAIWARKEVGVEFDADSYLKRMPDANEAHHRAAYEIGDYETASAECWAWLEDESFSARAAHCGAFINSTLLGRYDQALAFAEQGLQANPNQPMLINCKIFTLAYLGRAIEAQRFLPHLEAFEHHSVIKPYVHAARGLIAYRLGNFVVGRDHYLRTLESCRDISSPSLVAHATIYWLEQELFAGTTDGEDAAVIVAKLDDFYNRKENGSGTAPIWKVRKKIIQRMVDENSKRQAALMAYSKTKQPKIPLLIE